MFSAVNCLQAHPHASEAAFITPQKVPVDSNNRLLS